jgi:hypothetical protein
MAVDPYNYIHQDIVSTALILPLSDDSFYNPTTTGHTGFAHDGSLYSNGAIVPGPIQASWFTEPAGPYRGDGAPFPATGLILLSKVALTILDQSNTALPLWMQFILGDNMALANNFSTSNPNFANQLLDGWTPNSLAYADGIISVTYVPDAGAYQIDGISTPPVITGPFAVGSETLPGTAILTISETAGNVVTLTAATNYLGPGRVVQLNGLTTGTWLNGHTVTLIQPTNATTLTFVDPTSHGLQTLHSETGGVTDTGTPIGHGPNMVVNIDFTLDQIYLDAAVDTPPFD